MEFKSSEKKFSFVEGSEIQNKFHFWDFAQLTNYSSILETNRVTEKVILTKNFRFCTSVIIQAVSKEIELRQTYLYVTKQLQLSH